MAPAAPAPAQPKKPGSRATKRLETVRASSNAAGVRKGVKVFCTQADMVMRGTEDLVVMARVTTRVTAMLPKEALAPNGIVPMRTRGKNQRNLGFFDVSLQAKDATLMTAAVGQLFSPAQHCMQILPVEAFPDGPAISIIVSEEHAVGELCEFLVATAGVKAISYSKKVPRHVGFGHCVLVANTTKAALAAVGGARVTNVEDVMQVGLTAAENSEKATIYDGVLIETPLLQLAVLGDLERADLEEGGVTLQWLAEYLGIAESDFSQLRRVFALDDEGWPSVDGVRATSAVGLPPVVALFYHAREQLRDAPLVC